MLDKLIYVLIFLSIILWIWAFIDICKLKFKSPLMKIIWLLAILLFPILGPLFYFHLKKNFSTRKKNKKYFQI